MRLHGPIILVVALAVSGGATTAPAAVSARVLAPLPYAAQALTAYDGYVVFSQSSASGRVWHLMAWHAGAVSALPRINRLGHMPSPGRASPGRRLGPRADSQRMNDAERGYERRSSATRTPSPISTTPVTPSNTRRRRPRRSRSPARAIQHAVADEPRERQGAEDQPERQQRQE